MEERMRWKGLALWRGGKTSTLKLELELNPL
jgi:hypothetical protein